LAPPPAAVVADLAVSAGLALVGAAPAVLAQLQLQVPVLVLVDLAVLVPLAVPALPEVVVALAAEEEPEALVELLSRQSFSAVMARTTT